MAKRRNVSKRVSEELRRHVRDSGLSTRQLERGTGVHNSVLSRFLREERSLRLDAVDALAEFLKLRLVDKDEGD